MPTRPRARFGLASSFVLFTFLAWTVSQPARAQIQYPRLGMPGLIHGDGTPYLDSLTGGLNLPVIDAVARYDHVILDVSPVTEYHPEIIAALRTRNSNIKTLAYVSGEHIWDINAADSLVQFPTRYNHLVRNLGGFLYDTQGNPYPNYDINIAKRDANGRYVVAEAIAQLFHDVVAPSGLWDGMFVDVFCDDISWSQSPSEMIDFTRAGYPSIAALDIGWRAGSDTLASRLRSLFGPNFILVGNCGLGTKYGWFNGWTREDFPNQEGGTWQANMFRDPGGLIVDEARFRQPTYNQICTLTDGISPYDAASLRKLRFGFGTASLLTGFSLMGSEGRNRNSLPSEEWWYDEYAVDIVSGQAMADLSHTHWLGHALGAPYQMIWAGTGQDACSNPGFETSVSTGWSFGHFSPGLGTIARDTTTAGVGAASAHITVTSPGVNLWDVNLASLGSIFMAQGTRYSATFWAKASSARTIYVSATLPAGGELADQAIDIGTQWKQYQIVFNPTSSGSVILEFFLGHMPAGEVWFDDVHLQAGETNMWRRDFENGIVLVNPAVNSLDVPLGTPFRKILGTRDPFVNNGATITTATVGASDALFLIGAPRDTIPPSPVRDARVGP